MEVFRWEPFHTPSVTPAHNVITTTFETGRTKRYYKGRRPRVWTLKFQVTYEDALDILRFYNAMRGPFSSFLWKDPHSGEYITVHFKDDNVTLESEWQFNGFLTVTLEEVL